MTTAPHKLRAVPAPSGSADPCTLVCQATLSGPQEITVRVLTPVSGPGRPHVAVRVGSVVLLIAETHSNPSRTLSCRSDSWLTTPTAGPSTDRGCDWRLRRTRRTHPAHVPVLPAAPLTTAVLRVLRTYLDLSWRQTRRRRNRAAIVPRSFAK
jgi:hypothetical protein